MGPQVYGFYMFQQFLSILERTNIRQPKIFNGVPSQTLSFVR